MKVDRGADTKLQTLLRWHKLGAPTNDIREFPIVWLSCPEKSQKYQIVSYLGEVSTGYQIGDASLQRSHKTRSRTQIEFAEHDESALITASYFLLFRDLPY